MVKKFDQLAYVREWKKKNKDKIDEYRRQEKEKFPERVKQRQSKADKKFYAQNQEKIRERNKINERLKRKYYPEAQKKRMVAYRKRQEAKRWEIAGSPRASECKICKESCMTVFDHCHASGKFRGWICDRCNRVLGSVKDEINLLKQMINYLEVSI